MTWILIRLKLQILRNGLHGSRSRRISSLLMLVGSFFGSGFGALRIVHSAHGSGLAREESLILSMTVLFGLWVFGPLLVGGVDDALDPTRLVLLPLTRRELRKGLLCSALIGVLPLATLVTLSGVIAGYAGLSGAAIVAPMAALTMLVFCVGASRALSVALAFAGRSRRGKDLSVLIASLGAAALFLGTQSIRFLKDSQRHSILRALRLLPPGQIATAVLEADANQFVIATARLAGLAVISAVLLRAWFRGVDRLLVDPDSIRHTRRVKNRLGIALVPTALQPWITNPTVVMTAKELRYLVRSPQRRSSMIISIVIGTVFALLQAMRFNSANTAAVFGAPIAMLFGVHATNNLLGTDAASLWMEQTAGARLRQQLVSRGIAATPNLIVPTILAAFVLACMTGGWAELGLVVALSLTCWGIPLGVGSVISVIAPFNQPDVGNPYSNKRSNTGQSGLVSALAFVGIVSLMLFAIPCAGLVGVGWKWGSVSVVAIGVLASTIYSVVLWKLGLRAALRVVRGREVDLLSTIGGRRAAT